MEIPTHLILIAFAVTHVPFILLAFWIMSCIFDTKRDLRSMQGPVQFYPDMADACRPVGPIGQSGPVGMRGPIGIKGPRVL